MFNKIENGTLIEIPDNAFGYVYNCWIPPEGFGQNSMNGDIKETDILKSSDIPEEQCWVRPQLPSDYVSRRRKEKQVQKIDPLYVDSYLEDIRKREWKRRLLGVWFWNYNPSLKKSELIYITGLHYLYITYWKFQGKYLDFRIPDRDLFYVVSYCMFDPNSLGLNELTKRKNGKTARVGCWLYERVSRLNDHHGGIQSKADDDAWEVFKKAIVHPWKTLPDFFRPLFDTMKGDDPNDELRFFASSRRGSKTEEDVDDLEEPLNSFIDFKPSSEAAYDGPELHSYISDESGKTKKPVSIQERQNVVRYCSEIDGVFQGKHWYTTTVEPDKGEEENYDFQEMTSKSNPLDRDDNGRTGTGLYTYFLPAYRGMFFDKYGYAKEEDAKVFLMNTRRKYEIEGDTRKLSSFKRKNPMSFKEAFSADGEFALYNPELLNRQLDNISWTNQLTEFGDLVWEDGHRVKKPVQDANGEVSYIQSKVLWVSNPNGKYEKVVGFEPKEPNKVYYNSGSYMPNNNWMYRIGCDPFRYDKTKDKRRSNCAAFGYQLPDPLDPNNKYSDTFVIRYSQRPDSTRIANEDILKMAWWLGCEVLFERNVNHWKNDFQDWECAGFLMWMRDEVEPGIITAGGAVQTLCNYTEAYINEHIEKVFFKTLIRKDAGWLGFKIEDTEKFDEPMGAGITLIAVKGNTAIRQNKTTIDISNWFQRKKVG